MGYGSRPLQLGKQYRYPIGMGLTLCSFMPWYIYCAAKDNLENVTIVGHNPEVRAA